MQCYRLRTTGFMETFRPPAHRENQGAPVVTTKAVEVRRVPLR